MGRIIELQVDETTYTLEFNRNTLLKASDIQEEIEKAKTNSEKLEATRKLVKCAFLKNHPNITDDEVEDIIYSIEDLSGFINAVAEIMQSSVEFLKEKKGNAHWVVK